MFGEILHTTLVILLKSRHRLLSVITDAPSSDAAWPYVAPATSADKLTQELRQQNLSPLRWSYVNTHAYKCKTFFLSAHVFSLFARWMNAEQRTGFTVQRCPMLLSPLRGWPRSRMDIRTHVTGTQCSRFRYSFVLQPFTSPCPSQLCNVRGEPRWYGQWYTKSCLSSTGRHPTPPNSRLRFRCRQSEARDCTIRLSWLVLLQ